MQPSVLAAAAAGIGTSRAAEDVDGMNRTVGAFAELVARDFSRPMAELSTRLVEPRLQELSDSTL